ncbi:MAG: RNA-binding cell elongation regulator Jag/EloR [Fusobacterium sp.]
MADFIEIKAMNQEEAKKRAIRVLDLDEQQILNIIEKNKSKSFLGFFNKEGLYKIEYTTTKIIKEKKVVETKEIVKIKENLKLNKESKTIENKEKIEEIYKLSQEVLDKMNLNLKVNFLEFKDKIYYINLSGEDQGIIIGKKGKTLNSFEYLLNSLLKDIRVSVDVEGFKEKRNKTLRELATKMALKAIKTKRVVRLNPMPPRERKIIHEIINQYPELDTFSEGRDPKRYIVIKRKK